MRAATLIATVFLPFAVIESNGNPFGDSEQHSRMLEVIEAQYMELKHDVFAKRIALNQHYQTELKQILERAEAGGAADIARAARAEIETFNTFGRPGKISPVDPIARLQEIYLKQIPAITSSELSEFAALTKGYREKLAEFRKEMINVGEVELAFQTHKATQRLESDIEQMKLNASGGQFYIPGTQPTAPSGSAPNQKSGGIWE